MLDVLEMDEKQYCHKHVRCARDGRELKLAPSMAHVVLNHVLH